MLVRARPDTPDHRRRPRHLPSRPISEHRCKPRHVGRPPQTEGTREEPPLGLGLPHTRAESRKSRWAQVVRHEAEDLALPRPLRRRLPELLDDGQEDQSQADETQESIADIGVPEVPELLQQIIDSGGHLWACRMSAEMQHLDQDNLYEEVEAIISASDFIEMTAGAQLLFI
jgi:predicted peroxiredoxin